MYNKKKKVLFEKSQIMDIITLYQANLSFIPVAKDKRPISYLLPNYSWREYIYRRPTLDEVSLWNNIPDIYIGLICGSISGNVEVIDIDNHGGNASEIYKDLIWQLQDRDINIYNKLVIEMTQSGGYHLIYKHNTGIVGSKKLARQLINDKTDTMIETRGEKAYAIVHPSPNYKALKDDVSNIQTLEDNERLLLIRLCEGFNKVEKRRPFSSTLARQISKQSSADVDTRSLKEIIDFVNQYMDYASVLKRAGWHLDRVDLNGQEYWTRPGKSYGISASYGYLPNKFFVFSSNADPFEPNVYYSHFDIYALLQYNGDYEKACKNIRNDLLKIT